MNNLLSPKASAILDRVRTAYRELAAEVGVIEGAEAVAIAINYEAMSLGTTAAATAATDGEPQTLWGFLPPPSAN